MASTSFASGRIAENTRYGVTTSARIDGSATSRNGFADLRMRAGELKALVDPSDHRRSA